MQYRKKPVVIEATRWFRNGDHPEDGSVSVRLPAPGQNDAISVHEHTGELVPDPVTGAPSFLSEGLVVRYYRHPSMDGQKPCQHCGRIMHDHGWIDTLEGGHIVCPGDWVITGVAGERYPCKDLIFRALYEPVEG